ncbi:hypothetical protein CRYO30217_02634 [Parvicella tangerina]|uniref:Uncharacterized protein n=1 Tax=Parvicella tangerina TaxID=2829795 RepID=A0A916NCD5_9FLAO|nr:hypothetical protein CRYO30217_02634 [Parvicella tangerina]
MTLGIYMRGIGDLYNTPPTSNYWEEIQKKHPMSTLFSDLQVTGRQA